MDNGTSTHEDFPAVTICGSMRFYPRMLEIAAELTSAGRIVLMPHDASLTGVPDKTSTEHGAMLDAMHRAKIRMSEAVCVVSTGGYIGESTRGEIEYATELGIPVEYDDAQLIHVFAPPDYVYALCGVDAGPMSMLPSDVTCGGCRAELDVSDAVILMPSNLTPAELAAATADLEPDGWADPAPPRGPVAAPVDVLAVLEEGGTLTVDYMTGEPGSVTEDGDVVEPPHDGGYWATLRDADGVEVGWAGGETPAEALASVHGPYGSGEGGDLPPF